MSTINNQTANGSDTNQLNNKDQTNIEKIDKKVIFLSIAIGLIFNWLSLYLNITLGFLSIGISVFFVLLIGKLFLRENATNKNLALILIAYIGATTAEASVSILQLIWLVQNGHLYFPELSANFFTDLPNWLLPSENVLNNKIILSPEWILPLVARYFLMFIPGIFGLVFGFYIKDKFIHDDKTYPFPSVIQRNAMVDVLVTNQTDKIKLFRNFLIIGFLFSLLTTFFLPVIDLSQPKDGWILGISFGVVGVALFSVGYIINNAKMSITAGLSSLAIYTFASQFLAKYLYNDALQASLIGDGYYDFYNFALGGVFISFIIGFLVSAILFVPMIWKQSKRIISKIRSNKTRINSLEKNSNDSDNKLQNSDSNSTDTDSDVSENDNSSIEKKGRFSKIKVTKREIQFFSIFALLYLLSVMFIYYFMGDYFGNNILIILFITFWILIVGTIATGLIAIEGSAKVGAVMVPPFIFDLIPLYLSGARGLTPYVGTPTSEIRETMVMVSNSKFAKAQGITSRQLIIAYLMGYLPSIITTPIFALLLWQTFGIGTTQLPAPAFPVTAALIIPFASGDITSAINIMDFFLGGLAAVIFGPGIAIGAVFGALFPPHMALALTMGGLTRLLVNKKMGEKVAQDKGNTAVTALSVGASFVIPILILQSILM